MALMIIESDVGNAWLKKKEKEKKKKKRTEHRTQRHEKCRWCEREQSVGTRTEGRIGYERTRMQKKNAHTHTHTRHITQLHTDIHIHLKKESRGNTNLTKASRTRLFACTWGTPSKVSKRGRKCVYTQREQVVEQPGKE
jgi:hypothetical protein